MKTTTQCLMMILLTISAWSFAEETSPTAQELVARIDKLYRLDSSHATMTMDIQTPEWQRSMTMEVWSRDMDYTLVRILTPKKDAGIATLKRQNEMWNYFPKIRKVIKVPPSMMMGSWMGSDFTNDDLVREVSLAEEYDVVLDRTESQYLLTLTPKEQTVTVWGRIDILIDKTSLLPVQENYFDEDGTAMREMYFSDVREFDGRQLPAVMELKPLNKEGHLTRVTYDSLSFNTEVDESLFTLRNLKTLK
ncbi:outer membrane lipoprotein-sorting protein [Gynuella sp.]|uniref:outer membrane lipoprotein-sorting protein n=1 Tax=Gynuella sp. TaxID=2969146 RepID=UPI003D0AD342